MNSISSPTPTTDKLKLCDNWLYLSQYQKILLAAVETVTRHAPDSTNQLRQMG